MFHIYGGECLSLKCSIDLIKTIHVIAFKNVLLLNRARGLPGFIEGRILVHRRAGGLMYVLGEP